MGFKEGNQFGKINKGRHNSSTTEFKKGHVGFKGMLGRQQTPEARKKISITHKGNKAWNKDKRFPELAGENHPNWKGGVIKSRHNSKQKKRMQLLQFLGGKCIKCGFSDSRALQVDHINGGGVKEYKKIGLSAMYKRVFEHRQDYQILCANCNWIKRFENQEWPNKRV